MASITLKNVPEDLRLKLKEMAEQGGRSLNQEIIQNLRVAASLRRTPKEIEAEIAAARESRRQLEAEGYWISPEAIERRIQEGRRR